MNVDWDAVQIQYEVFHESIENIAAENQISRSLVEYAIEDKGWKRTKLNGQMQQVKDVGDLEEVTDDVINSMGDRLSAINMLKAATMNPRYIALETAILAKAREIVSSITPGTPTAGDQLKKVSEVLDKLRTAAIPNNMAGQHGNGDDGRIVVQIMNTVDLIQQEKEPTPVIEIGSSAGAQ